MSRRILRFCAVLGRSFRREVLQRILEADDLALDAKMLPAPRLLHRGRRRGPTPVPQQPGSRRGLRGPGLPGAVRIHRMAGEVLEDISTDLDVDSPTLALHFERASALRVPGATP